MTFYGIQASGLLGGVFAWSNNAIVSSSLSEAAVADAFDTAYRLIFTDASFKAYIPATVTVEATSASTMSPVFTQTTKTSNVSETAGDGSDAALGYRTCEIVTFRTAQATRFGRGRWYFPPLGYNALAADGFSMLDTAQTDMAAALTSYFSSVGSSYSHVILHRKQTHNDVRAAYTTDTVTGADVPNTFATQKRRADKIVPSRLSITV